MTTSFACIIKGFKNRSLFQSLQGRVFLQNGGLFMPSVMMHNEVRNQGRLKCFKILLLGYAVKCEPIQTSSLFTFDYSCLFVITPLGIETHPFSAMRVVNKLNESHLYAHKSRFKRWPFHKFHIQRSMLSEKRTGLSGQLCLDRAINCPFSVWKVIGIRVLRLYSPISLPFRTCLMRHGSKNLTRPLSHFTVR